MWLGDRYRRHLAAADLISICHVGPQNTWATSGDSRCFPQFWAAFATRYITLRETITDLGHFAIKLRHGRLRQIEDLETHKPKPNLRGRNEVHARGAARDVPAGA